jgi:DNA invertase Pin-like site-specific DNA recombinase
VIHAADWEGDTHDFERFLDTTEDRDTPWFQRPGGRALAERLKSGDRILVAALAVIFTRAQDMAVMVDLLQDRRVTLVLLDQYGTLTPDNPFLNAMRVAFQVLHSWKTESHSEAIQQGLIAKRARGGRHCNHPGYGKM